MQQEKTKPALVFLHYFGGAALSWQWVTEKLVPAYHCFVPDLPGFGGQPPLTPPSIEEMARWVENDIRKAGIGEYVLIGHSMGGKIAVQVAANDAAGAVQHLILVAPSPPSIEPIPAAEKERMLIHPDRAQAETTVRNSTHQPLSDAQHHLTIATQLIADPRTWAWWIKEGTTHSIQDQISKIRTPITVLASKDDPAISFDTIQHNVMALLPQATLVTTTGIGHLSPMEAPDWLAAQIIHAVSGRRQ